VAEVIVALDVPSRAAARRLLDALPGLGWVKIGPMLLLAGGLDLIAELKDRGIRVFLDLKWHDIPHAVAGAVAGAARLGVDLVTVHALGGEEMVRAAVRARGTTRVAGVTVLTSHTEASLAAALGRSEVDLEAEVARLAGMLVSVGVDAIVASPQEIATVRAVAGPAIWIVVPGIRPPGTESGDQRRVATPAAAAAAGASHLVVGRPILEAKNPGQVYQAICEAIAGI
jgi:orotidine-5'-phosphate decarboxylase